MLWLNFEKVQSTNYKAQSIGGKGDYMMFTTCIRS
jgi:hypothetical protein